MRARRAIALTLLAVVAVPSAARANYAFQGVVSASGGWTNNASGAPAATPNTPTDADSFFLISPGIVFTSMLARAVQRISYTFSALTYSHHPELSTLSNRLDWSGIFTPTRTTELLVNAYGSQLQLNTLNTVGVDATTAPAQLTRAGTQTYWNAGANESLVWNWSQFARLQQGTIFIAVIPQGSGLSQTYTATENLALERVYRRNAFAGLLHAEYTYYQEQRGPVTNSDGTVNPNGVVLPAQQQLLWSLKARWRRDFGVFWATDLSAGPLLVMRANDGGGRIWQPDVYAAVHYLNPKFQSDLSYAHGAIPNALVQQTMIDDMVIVRAVVPFGLKTRIAFNADGFYTHSKEVDSHNGSLAGDIHLFSADAGLSWSPLAGLSLFARYTYAYQMGGSTAAVVIPDMQRHVVLVGISGIYPTEAAAVVPSRHALRVDGTDMTGIGELHSQPPASR